MCGIAGVVRFDEKPAAEAAQARRMGESIAHRGPDGDGRWWSPERDVVLIHRRLSVIDLVTGDQPMRDEGGRHTLVFNGEIYNYKALRDRLTRRGHRFRTTSDTEVLLRHLGEYGAAGIRDLRGMFAFAFWDAVERKLLLARDRVGKKPLFFHWSGERLAFASTLGTLEAALPVRPAVNQAAVESFLRLGYIPAPAAIFDGVKKVPAGHLLTVDATGPRLERYWSFDEEAGSFEGRYEDALDRLDALLREAVALRLQSDVPLGIFLSGGIDSSLVTAMAADQSAGEGVETFSIAFDHSDFDESGHAAAVAGALGTRHHSFRGEIDLLDLLPIMVRHFGEPFGDATALATWVLARESRRFVTVALAGDGGDEGFGGYDWYTTAAKLKGLGRWLPGPFGRSAARVGTALAGAPWARVARMGRGLRAVALDDATRFGALRTFVAPEDSRSLLAGGVREAHEREHRPGDLESLYRSASGSPFRRMRSVDIESYLADCLLPKVDVATMAHGLEARAPLLDQEVLRFALSLPDAWMTDPKGGKPLLRDLLARYLPRPLFERPKQGFNVPLQPWFANGLRERVDGLARSDRLLDTGWFRPAGIRALAEQHAAGARDHSQRIFNLIVLDEWLSRL